MAEAIEQKLIEYIDDAHAMEENVLQMLGSLIATTTDDEIVHELEHHRVETERHIERLDERLRAHGTEPSARKQAQTLASALVKGVADQVRGDKAGKNARDGFVTEHLEIAAYELLERLATRAGDTQTAQVARENRADEEAMAQKIASKWDKVLELTLAEEGLTV